jgi:hypothetical protein
VRRRVPQRRGACELRAASNPAEARLHAASYPAEAGLHAASYPAEAGLHAASSTTPKYADGAPPGFTGGFGEQACDACHFEAAVNTKPGQLTLTGVPQRFAAGERYSLTLTLSRPGMAMGGFQLSARMENGGAQAGALTPGPGEEKRIKIEPGNVQYANQRLAGTAPAEPGTARWTVIWTAPATPGAVIFHAAANAADKDEAARGDYIYTATASSRAQ